MKVIYKGRCEGKTTTIIQETLKNDGYLLVQNYRNQILIEDAFPQMKDRVFSWKNYPSCLLGKQHKKLYIDNAEYFLNELLNKQIAGITINKETK